MGKSSVTTADDDGIRQQPPADIEEGSNSSCRCCRVERCCWIARAFTLRCVIVLVLSVCVFLSALFWLPPFHAFRSGRSREANTEAPIKASFILHTPVNFLSLNKKRLEYDIFEEIGVPNTKVSVISMHSLAPSNSTYVVFGILPDPKHVQMNPVILSVLRSSLIEVVIQQSNLSLTPSIFGQPSSFEILKFPGGITIIPVQSAPIWQITQNLFNFTLNNSIDQIQKNLDELKGQLKFGLNLKYYENVYVQMTNSNGSTVEPPVIMEASVLSDVGSRNLLPPRLKQLAQTITGSPTKNLGLNHTVFGKVKGVVLSSYLNHSIVLSGAPSPSPSPENEPPVHAPTTSAGGVAPSSRAPPPSTNPNNILPCFYCGAPHWSPSLAPSPDHQLPSPIAQPSSSPPCIAPSPVTIPSSHKKCLAPTQPPDISSSENPQPPASSKKFPSVPNFSPQEHPGYLSPPSGSLPHSPGYHSDPSQGRTGGETSTSRSFAGGPISPFPSSSFASNSNFMIRHLGVLWFLAFHLL